MTQNKNIFYILLLFAMIGWGGSWVNVKVLSSYVNPYEFMFIRFFITSISMVPILFYLKKSWKIDLKTLLLAILGSILMLAYTKYFVLGTKLGTASLGGAFVTTLIPINTFMILVIFFKKPFLKKDIFALSLGAIGVMTILGVWHLDSSMIFTKYNFYFILASLAWPLLTITSSFARGISPIVFSFYIYVITTILGALLIDVGSLKYESWDTTFWVHMLIISIVATTFSTSFYFIGIERLGAKEVSSFIFLVPFAAISLSIIVLNEAFNVWMILGTALTILAVSILNNLITFKIKKR